MNASPYSHTDTSENEAILTFYNAINRKLIKTDIKSRDKFPNYDGYIEIVDDKGYPKGKLEVQVKAIKKGDNKFYCKLENMYYAENCTTLPILLILSDIESNIVYWKHLHKNNCKISKEKKSYIFSLSDTDIVNKTNNYITLWQSIVNDYQNRIILYNNATVNIQLEDKILIKNLSTKSISYFQRFIDKINHGIQFQYPFIKKIIYPGIWKLGVAIRTFEDDIAYSLYRIEQGHTDFLIKAFKENTDDHNLGKSIISSYFAAKKDKNPNKYANDFIHDKLKKIFEDKLFEINQIELAEEYCYSIVNKYYYMFGLKKNDLYYVKDILKRLIQYFPIWISEALIDYPLNAINQYISISRFSIYPHDDINERVDNIIKNKKNYKIGDNLVFYSKEYDLYLFNQCLNILSNNDIDIIDYKFKKPNYKLAKTNSPNYRHSYYTKEDIECNIQQFYLCIYDILREFLKANEFPQEFYPSLLPKYKIFIVPRINDDLYTFGAVGITTIKVELIDKFEEEITIIKDEEVIRNIDSLFRNYKFIYKEKEYNVIEWEDSGDISLFEETPFLDFIYKYLNNKLRTIQT